jgi:class 3 adenylate cyclase/tetratricopeptide (TPR) repeat protein
MSSTASCPGCGAPVAPGARFCSACGTPLGPTPLEERKIATILFADVIGSTDLGEQLDPERLRALLHEYFGAMARIVDAWGGSIEKYIGDAILAVWGVPVAREDDPARALHAAIEMLADLERLNDGFAERHHVRLGLRIGVNTGEVLAPIGSQRGGQFLVSGDAVNVAARLEQSADAGTTLVGERTWASARHAFEFGPPTLLSVKGKRAPLTARTLGRALSGDDQRTPFQAPMVGRERELTTLIGQLEETIETALPRLVVLSGPAGIGKSRMLREFIAAAADSFDKLLVLRGRCLSAGHGISLWALGEVLRGVCSISLDEPAESAVAKLNASIAGPLASIGLSVDEIALTAAALATSANLPIPENPLEGLEPEAVFEQMGRAWPRLVTGLARTWPLAILIEDIHWADEQMLSMLELLAARSHGPVLIVATARPEFVESHPGFGAGQDVSVVALRPLTMSQSGQLIDELLGTGGLPVALIDEMRTKADGNPFFLEEMLQRLVDEGALVLEDGHWRATERAGTVELSDTVHGVLAARIDALPADEKRFLQEASVVGRIFWPGALRGATGPSADNSDLLRSLERKGLVSVRPTSAIENERELMFRHVLIHDVAYASVPKSRRAHAHAEIGRWIEDLAGDRHEEFGELIAYHYSAAVLADDADLAWAGRAEERSRIAERAFEMLIRAGASARHRFAIDKALELHALALQIAPTAAGRARAHEEMGDDHEALFHGDEAVAAYLAAIDNGTAAGYDLEDLGGLVAKAARMTLRWGAFRETPPIDQVEALIRSALDQPVSERVRSMLLIAFAGLMRGPNGSPIATGRVLVPMNEMSDLNERVAAVEEGLAIARRLDDPTLQYLAYDLLGILYMSSRQEQRYRDTFEEALYLLERLPSSRQQVDLLVSVSAARADGGNYEQALAAAENAFVRAKDLSPHERMHTAWEIYRAADPLGRWDRIVELLPWYATASGAEGGITCAAVRGGPPLGATALARRGLIAQAERLVPIDMQTGTPATFGTGAFAARYALSLGRREEASAIADKTLANTQSGFLTTGCAPMLDVLGELGRFEELAEFIRVAAVERIGNAAIEPSIERAEARLAMARGDRAAARDRLSSALAGFEELSVAYECARTLELLAEVGEPLEAHDLLARAHDLYQSLGATPDADRVARDRDASEAAVPR